jgi:hypothetical protein
VSIRGTRAWEAFDALQDLRNGLVHLKRRGYSTDLDAPSEYGRLLRGDADGCARRAADVINAAEPGWISADVLAELS